MRMRAGANDTDKQLGKWVTQARNRLAARREEKPRTKARQIRALWWEIEAALADGQSLASIRDWLGDEEGAVTRATLSSYKKRFRQPGEADRNAEVLAAFVRHWPRVTNARTDAKNIAGTARKGGSQPGENRIRLPKPVASSKRRASISEPFSATAILSAEILFDRREAVDVEIKSLEALFAMSIFPRHQACAVFPSPRDRDRDVIGEMT
jgi:hypothetical protein